MAGTHRIAATLVLAAASWGCQKSCRKPIVGGTPMPTKTHALPGLDPFSAELSLALAEALAAKGDKYVPRTHHTEPNGTPKYTNRLILETSPYLLQHAHNPVNWFAWGRDAFAEAKRRSRPILLSVGYSTCHWCHVMERESFEDEEIATYINQHFIAIKVDREERPDVDSVYMTAVQLMTGGGGWPMTVLMLADGRPFFGGTYFPARDGDRGARIGFLTLLKRLHEAFSRDGEQVVASAERLTEALNLANHRTPPEALPTESSLVDAARTLAARFDPHFGGFGGAPKFPRPSSYGLLLRYARRAKDDGALRIVTRSLDGMTHGGLYDHVGGGFHRYSTDARWLVPHFEKMLYDNAQLVALLVETWQSTSAERFKDTAIDTLDYVLREMTSPEGAFFSATDADSEGEEGRFFVWTPAEIEAALPDRQAKIISAFYDVTSAGNFEGSNILHRPHPPEEIARQFGISESALWAEIEDAREVLYDIRKKRTPPLLDDKIIAEWNGQMIGAMARAGWAFGEPRYTEAARRAADFLIQRMRLEGRLHRTYRQQQAKHSGVLEDYAFVISGLLDLFEATGSPQWVRTSLELNDVLTNHFWDEEGGGYFATPDDGEALLIREKPLYDGAQPSGNSVQTLNLLRLFELTQDETHRERAERTLLAFGRSLENGALECPVLAQALDFYLDVPKQIVLVSNQQDDGQTLEHVLRNTFLPNRVLIRVPEDQVEPLSAVVPLVQSKRAQGGRATAYVCRAMACKKPTSDPAELRAQLAEVKPITSEKLSVPSPHR